MDQGLIARKRDCQAALLAALETDCPLWACQEQAPFVEEALGKVRMTSPVWGAPCLAIHPPLSPPEEQPFQGMKGVLMPEFGEVPSLTLSRYLKHEHLIQALKFWRPRSLWFLGEVCAQRVLRCDDSLSEFQAKQPFLAKLHHQECITILVTEHPKHLIDHIPGKRQAYDDLMALKGRMQAW